MAVPGTARGPLRPCYDAVIIGGGLQGMALAYELARTGMRDVCVVEASYPGAGASGRNGELIRSAFSSPEWATLFEISLRKWHTLSAELDVNVLFTPAGYLVLASTEADFRRCRLAAERHRQLGIRTDLLDARSVCQAVPALNPDRVAGGLFQRDGGFAHHDAVVWGYVRAAARQGVEVHPFTTVTGIRVEGGRVTGVETTRGTISTPMVIDAAGGQAREVAALAGVALPTRTLRLEAFVTEALRPFLRPGVALLSFLGYCHQTTRGEFVGGTEQRIMEPEDSLRTTLVGLRDACQKFVDAFPLLAGVRLIRQWAGVVDLTPDLAPVLGPAPEVEGFWLDCGWIYGFMGAPGAALLLAQAIVDGRMPAPLAPFTVERLYTGRLIEEASLVVAPPESAA